MPSAIGARLAAGYGGGVESANVAPRGATGDQVPDERLARQNPAKQSITMAGDRLLVQMPQSEEERRSRSGLLIPATVELRKRLAWAEVVAVGPQVRSAKQGDQVLFNPEDRFEVDLKGEEYLILRERDVHAVASDRLDSGTGLYL